MKSVNYRGFVQKIISFSFPSNVFLFTLIKIFFNRLEQLSTGHPARDEPKKEIPLHDGYLKRNMEQWQRGKTIIFTNLRRIFYNIVVNFICHADRTKNKNKQKTRKNSGILLQRSLRCDSVDRIIQGGIEFSKWSCHTRRACFTTRRGCYVIIIVIYSPTAAVYARPSFSASPRVILK